MRPYGLKIGKSSTTHSHDICSDCSSYSDSHSEVRAQMKQELITEISEGLDEYQETVNKRVKGKENEH